MTYSTITAHVDGQVGVLGLNRPKVLNAVNWTLMRETTAALAAFNGDPDVRAIVLHGHGRAFSSGFDLKESVGRELTGVAQWREALEEGFAWTMQFWDSPKPTIAAIHGHCIGVAFELALACDISVAAQGTRMGEPEVRFGAVIQAMLLPYAASPKLAKELLLTGDDRLAPERCLAVGIVNHVVPAGQALDKAMALARDIAAASPGSVQLTKQAINRSYEARGMRQGLLAALETAVLIASASGPDREEFNRVFRERGLQAALAWRDRRS